MLKAYEVLGRTVKIDPSLEYLKPDNVSSAELMAGSANFYTLNAEDFLTRAANLPSYFHNDFYAGIELHLMECRSILGFLEATEGDYKATKVVMDGPVESPNLARTGELMSGLKNTINLFEQLQKGKE